MVEKYKFIGKCYGVYATDNTKISILEVSIDDNVEFY